MSMPARWAARMIVSPGSNGICLSSSLNVGIRRLPASSIAFSTDHVERPEARHHVGDHLSRDHAFESAGDEETGRTDADAIRRTAAVAHEIEAELAVTRLGVRVGFARRN